MSYRYTLPTDGYIVESIPNPALGLTANTLTFIDSAGVMSDADAVAAFDKEARALREHAPVQHTRRLIHRTADGDRVLVDWVTIKPLQVLLSVPLTNAPQAEAWIHDMHAAGYGTHPDDPSDQIVKAGGEPLFTADQATLHTLRMDEVFALLDDPYAVALDAHHLTD